MMTNNEIIKGLKIIELTSETEQEKTCVQAAILALERQKCENCKILELLVDFELETICEDDGKDFEYCENNCDFKAPTKECYLHWADMRKESQNEV